MTSDRWRDSDGPPARPSVGSIITTLRRQNGLTQKDFAAALGVGRSTLAEWETDRGRKTPPLARMAELLGASVEVFLTGMASHDVTERVSLDEAEMLQLYRLFDVPDRLVAQRLVHSLLKPSDGAGCSRVAGGNGRLPSVPHRKAGAARHQPFQTMAPAGEVATRPAPGGDGGGRSVGFIVSALRKQNGLTQDALAASLGVTRGAVAQWETGRRGGSLTTHLARIAEVLGMPVEVFLTGMASHDTEERVSLDEGEMLQLYRRCTVIDRLAALHMLHALRQ